MTINDVGSPEQMRPTWSIDGRQIYFQAAYHGSSLLKRISLDGRDLQDVVGEGGVVGTYSFDWMQSKLAYFFGQMHDPGQVYLRELGSGSTRHLTRVNRELLDTISLPRVEEIWFKNPDGLSLQGWIMYPPRFDPKRKYPSILEIHGIVERVVPLGELKERIVKVTPGKMMAYVSDVIYSPGNAERIVGLARGADVLFIEACFLDEDRKRAADKYHLTALQAGRLARLAGVKRFVLFHYSPKYRGMEERFEEEAMRAFEGRE